MLKKVGLILMAIVIAALAFPLVLPKNAQLERKVAIQNTPAAVYGVLVDFNQFRSWDPWSTMEPESTFTVEGAGVGSVYAWEGKKTGKGSMKITAVEENKNIDVLLTFFEPFPGEATTGWRIVDLGNGQTEVTWHYEQTMGYFQRYFGVMMDGMMGGQFESGLAKLKARLEGTPPA